MDTLQNSISSSSIISTIRLALNSIGADLKTWILVEGPDDVKIYRKLFNSSTVSVNAAKLDNGLENCDSVDISVKELLKVSSNIIGIRDRDYLFYNPSYSTQSNIFFTDKRDIEMTMLSSEAYKTMMCEYPIEDYNNIISKALFKATYLGFIRLMNDSCNLEYKFKDLPYCYIFGPTCEDVDWGNKLISKINIKSLYKKHELTLDSVPNFVETNAYEKEDPFLICCGHDMINLLALLISDVAATKKTLPSLLRTSYSMAIFEKTELYNSLKRWSYEAGVNLFN
ncbi:DUF4435 domain-containing protein [uncultured Bacteroides sp.]|uniref:DUF4435 domain-containing protein n=1 Tax=uncultured Bacteroides sp. TaxID=162156 RepID=UPI002AAC0A26|nr:DUF4435 domain-containing protein [uncultured Bacteroides sp.]